MNRARKDVVLCVASQRFVVEKYVEEGTAEDGKEEENKRRRRRLLSYFKEGIFCWEMFFTSSFHLADDAEKKDEKNIFSRRADSRF